MPEPTSAPYRTALVPVVAAALAAGVGTGLADVAWTLADAAHVRSTDATGFALVAISLYAAAAVVAGAVVGVVAGAVRATHPAGSLGAVWHRLRRDEATDRMAAGALVAAAGAALFYVLVVATLAIALVAKVERQSTGALLLGIASVVALAPAIALAYPLYRVARRVAQVVPRAFTLPATFWLAAAGVFGGVLLGAAIVVTRLDWRALKLGTPIMLALLGGLTAALLLLFYGPLAGLRTKIPAPGRVVTVAALTAVLAAAIVVPTVTPSERTVALLTVESRGARTLVQLARRAGDGDGDGFSRWLGGGDCNDHNREISPGAKEKPQNGIDENCNGADAPAPVTPGSSSPSGPGAGDPPGPSEAPALTWKGNVMVIAVDTLRADKFGAAGYRRGGKSLTPHMDALAARGVWFTHTWAQAPHTPRSFPSLFSSRFPSAITWSKAFANYPRLEPQNQTMWEALSAAGLFTVGEASHFYFGDEFGITQGFTEFDNSGATDLKGSNSDIASPRIVPRVKARLSALAQSKQRFAMFVHLFEPHSTYVAHDGFEYRESGGRAAFEEKYDREVEFVDRYVGEIVDALATTGLADDTLIVLVADHGEAFFTHSYAGQALGWHGQSLYDDVLRVPFIVAGKGIAPAKIDTPVMLLDVAPTVCALLGVPVPASFQGRSLVPALAGQALSPAPAYAELLPYPNFKVSLKAMITVDGARTLKVIQNFTDQVVEVFDLSQDPGEQQNLGFDQPDLSKKLRQDLAAWVDSL